MSFTNYFLNFENWSILWLIGLFLILLAYLWKMKPRLGQAFLFVLALGLCCLVFGSPLNTIKEVGLHSIGMVQQILILMVIPVLVLISIPKRTFKTDSIYFRWLSNFRKYFILTWVIGAVAMWVGHYLSAAILSSRTGLAICGVQLNTFPALRSIPDNLVLLVLLFAGFIFALPVFHPDPQKRIAPLKRVIYLFTSCVNCSALGLYVVFSASAATVYDTVQSMAYRSGVLPWSLHTDQELAGMIMWVPGCLLYVLASVSILLAWYEDEESDREVSVSTTENYLNNFHEN